MNEQIKAGSDIHAGDGGYSISTKEKYEAFVKARNYSYIKSLISQVGTDSSGKWMSVDDVEELVNLVVRKCAEFANEHNSEVEDVTLGIGKAIKQHFGVEE